MLQTSNGDVFEKTHDELDFEFLGNVKGKPWRFQTNVYGNGSTSRGREERYRLWFDPSKEFHRYSILWTAKNIMWAFSFLSLSFPIYVSIFFVSFSVWLCFGLLFDLQHGVLIFSFFLSFFPFLFLLVYGHKLFHSKKLISFFFWLINLWFVHKWFNISEFLHIGE